MSNKQEALKPCPCCGGEAVLYELKRFRWTVACLRCPMTLDRQWRTKETPIGKWNTRPAPPIPDDVDTAANAVTVELTEWLIAEGCLFEEGPDEETMHRFGKFADAKIAAALTASGLLDQVKAVKGWIESERIDFSVSPPRTFPLSQYKHWEAGYEACLDNLEKFIARQALNSQQGEG